VEEGVDYSWPIIIQDRDAHQIYLTYEGWDHALGHPGMDNELLDFVLATLHKGGRKQDAFDRTKYKYTLELPDLPMPYTHVVVVVKFGWRGSPPEANNFVLTAYLVEKW
jgi:hypothetical protein